MPARYDDVEAIAAVDAAISEWRQGDVVRSAHFFHAGNPGKPGTEFSQSAADADATAGLKIFQTSVDGLVVISQTCDIVAKSASDAPFVDLAVLVSLPVELADQARAGDRPRFVHVSALGNQWFADLDRVVTIEKASLLDFGREAGLSGTEQQEAFGVAVGRKFSRFAFPDDLHETLRSLQERIKKRHNRAGSDEGAILRDVRQIRAEAIPSWESVRMEVHLYFILPSAHIWRSEEPLQPTIETVRWYDGASRGIAQIATRLSNATVPDDVAWLWEKLVDAWADACVPIGAITRVTAEVTTADEMTVAQYWRTQQLDLDYLSSPSDTEQPSSVAK